MALLLIFDEGAEIVNESSSLVIISVFKEVVNECEDKSDVGSLLLGDVGMVQSGEDVSEEPVGVVEEGWL